MKRLILLLALCLIVGAGSAAPLTFQNEHDFTYHMNVSGSPLPYYSGSTTAGNSYIIVPVGLTTALRNSAPNPFTYAAWTDVNPAPTVQIV